MIGSGLWVVDADGSDARRLTDNDIINEWSWSLGRLFYEVDVKDSPSDIVDRELWVVGLDSSNARKLVENVAVVEDGRSVWGWSPDGERIVYGVDVKDSSGSWVAMELWVVGLDGSNARMLAEDVNRWFWQPVDS